MAGIFSRFQDPATAPDPRLARRAELESLVRTNLEGFVKAGAALATIRDEGLHKLTHGTFAEYVEATFSLSVRRAYQLITGATLAESVKQVSHGTNGALPTADELPAADQHEIRQALNGRRPKTSRKKKARKKAKPITIRVDGGTVIVKPKKADADIAAILARALDSRNAQHRDAA